VTDPDGDPLTTKWIVNTDASTKQYPAMVSDASTTGATVTLPTTLGVYRVYVYISDGKGAGAEANVPVMDANPIETTAVTLPYVVYADGVKADFSPIGGYYQGGGCNQAIDQACTDNPHSGATCTKVTITGGGGWWGREWQNPEGNWGTVKGGFDFTGATKLTFWARGANGGETVNLGVGVVGADKLATQPYYDTAIVKKPFTLTKDWTQYTVDLTGKNLSRIVTAFSADDGPASGTFYLDDIQYEK
jgi:hypothetical protein